MILPTIPLFFTFTVLPWLFYTSGMSIAYSLEPEAAIDRGWKSQPAMPFHVFLPPPQEKVPRSHLLFRDFPPFPSLPGYSYAPKNTYRLFLS